MKRIVLLISTVLGIAIAARLASPQITQPISFPRGGIVLWSGALSSIPGGWVLCDGNNGTPDLRDRFVIGAGALSVNDTGGSGTHDHGLSSASIPPHSHTIATAVGTPIYRGNSHYLGVTTEHHGGIWGDQYEKNRYGVATDTLETSAVSAAGLGGATDPGSSLPPYYALAYIMKR